MSGIDVRNKASARNFRLASPAELEMRYRKPFGIIFFGLKAMATAKD
jgi:hypothetical protein